MEWRAQSRRVTLTSCMNEMRHEHNLSHAMWCAMSEDDDTRLNITKKRLRAHSLVKCRISCVLCWSWLSRCHWFRTSCRSVSPRIRNPSFLHVVVRLYLVIVSSNCSHNCCLLNIAKTGHLRRCLYTSRRLQ